MITSGLDLGQNPELQGQYWQAFNDVLAVAFSYGLTRIATILFDNGFGTYASGPWHQDVTHQALLPEKQEFVVEANRNLFELVFLDLAAKKDAIPNESGGTLLDKH